MDIFAIFCFYFTSSFPKKLGDDLCVLWLPDNFPAAGLKPPILAGLCVHLVKRRAVGRRGHEKRREGRENHFHLRMTADVKRNVRLHDLERKIDSTCRSSTNYGVNVASNAEAINTRAASTPQNQLAAVGFPKKKAMMNYSPLHTFRWSVNLSKGRRPRLSEPDGSNLSCKNPKLKHEICKVAFLDANGRRFFQPGCLMAFSRDWEQTEVFALTLFLLLLKPRVREFDERNDLKENKTSTCSLFPRTSQNALCVNFIFLSCVFKRIRRHFDASVVFICLFVCFHIFYFELTNQLLP